MFPFCLRSPWSNVRGAVLVSATPAAQGHVGTAVVPRALQAASEGQLAEALVEAWAG